MIHGGGHPTVRALIVPPGRHGAPDFTAAPNATCVDGDGVVTGDSLADVPRRWTMQPRQNGLLVNVTAVANMAHGQAVSDERAQRVTVEALLASAAA